MRIEVFFKNPSLDGRGHRICSRLQTQFPSISAVTVGDVYIVEGVDGFTPELAEQLFCDPVTQDTACITPAGEHSWDSIIEITYKPGVTDPVALTAREAVKTALPEQVTEQSLVQTARLYLISVDAADSIKAGEKPEQTARLIAAELYNPLIESCFLLDRSRSGPGEDLPIRYPHTVNSAPPEVLSFDISRMDRTALTELSRSRLLALSPDEMDAVCRFFSRKETADSRKPYGLDRNSTDVELEMIAQTWSEHCKHKIFNAVIDYYEGETVTTFESLFSTFIKNTTDSLRDEKKYLKSVFHDNSGVISFDEETLICFKVETHNSPSALDPYGGAITGIVGVNRDIIGTGKGAKPIFNTDVLCFGYPHTRKEVLPKGLLHPVRVLSGVHRGIIDGGNQSGVPVAGGAFLFDESYTGKPLVFCGTGGSMPAEIGGEGSWINHIRAGDKAIMVGGRIGKDGIHGATFSSQALDEESPTSAVQIGDPFTQKKMTDFLLEARDLQLYNGITDNGAGGLSSSLGEMAEKSGGVRIELDSCPLKYEGLAPWEILVSESQERMSVSVPPEQLDAFLECARKRDVEATVVGEFTDSGHVHILYEEKTVGYLPLEFLHNGLPTMHLTARWVPPAQRSWNGNRGHSLPAELESIPVTVQNRAGLKELFFALLREPNIASKEGLVRQYDHEVQGCSIIKPFTGVRSDAPSDGAVLKPRYDSFRGITVTHGICPRIGDIDTYTMALCAVDEAYRSHIGCGGNPDLVSALDNFCWPDPVQSEQTPDGEYKLAQLVRACMGLRDACLAYGIPLISGKDSMKNDAGFEGKKVSVRPTLLISLLGVIDDIRKAVSTDFKRPGDAVFLIGAAGAEMGGSMAERITGTCSGKAPSLDLNGAVREYRLLGKAIEDDLVESCHDISDGGLAVAAAESCIGGDLGARITIGPHSGAENAVLLFNESPARFLVSVKPENRARFETLFGQTATMIGEVTSAERLTFFRGEHRLFAAGLEELRETWKMEQFQ
jgi:phosphoribosylformylglycinamidine synthase subunit PurSL